MSDPQIVDLCRRIYTNHRRAIDLIIAHRPTPVVDLLDAIEASVRSDESLHVIVRRTNELSFVPTGWVGGFPPISSAPKFPPWAWLVVTFQWFEGRLSLIFYAGPTKDLEKRNRIINRLRDDTRLALKTRASKLIDNEWRPLESRACGVARDDEIDVPALVARANEALKEWRATLDLVPRVVASIDLGSNG